MTLEELIAMFAGKTVRVTHTAEKAKCKDREGICKTIHNIPGKEDEFDLEFENGDRLGFQPQVVTEDSIDGDLNALAGGRRKIQVVA